MDCWVAVYNLTHETRLLAIHSLLQFGQVVQQHVLSSSLILVRFAEPLFAQAALLRRALPLSQNSVIGITEPQENWLRTVPKGNQGTNSISFYPERRMPKVKVDFIQKILDLIW
ncbi:hypothetical protein SS50377_22165 [Spironucleus salmonicida]|uniref:Uncharacterized protein n=1 Tax=Spironucleus salmonicida TaxID=348837 RepID=V6LM05_9EUKA|nr:hypothetical protein SS50377_22165 [Spironucleus salmonicida]|eukprot:EST45675.1 hypothetical protein SS50377_14247 [Spironucleus salmonicida]